MNELLLVKLKNLKFSGGVKSIDMRNEQATKDNLSYMEFVELLVNDEVLNRQNNANIKRTSKAKFPQHKSLEEYNLNYQPTVNKRFIYKLEACEFIRKKENIAFVGLPETGKPI